MNRTSFAVFGYFSKAGVALHAYDAHGHGRSEPQDARDRCLIWSFDHLVSASLFSAIWHESTLVLAFEEKAGQRGQQVVIVGCVVGKRGKGIDECRSWLLAWE